MRLWEEGQLALSSFSQNATATHYKTNAKKTKVTLATQRPQRKNRSDAYSCVTFVWYFASFAFYLHAVRRHLASSQFVRHQHADDDVVVDDDDVLYHCSQTASIARGSTSRPHRHQSVVTSRRPCRRFWWRHFWRHRFPSLQTSPLQVRGRPRPSTSTPVDLQCVGQQCSCHSEKTIDVCHVQLCPRNDSVRRMQRINRYNILAAANSAAAFLFLLAVNSAGFQHYIS